MVKRGSKQTANKLAQWGHWVDMRNIGLHIMQLLSYILGRGLGENETGARCWGLAMYPWELMWSAKKVGDRAPFWAPPWLPALQAQIRPWTNVDGMGYASQCVEVSNEAKGGAERAREGGNGGERRHQPTDFDWADWWYKVAISSKTLSKMSSLSLKPSSKMSSPLSKTSPTVQWKAPLLLFLFRYSL